MSESILKVLSLPATLANGPGVLSPVIVYDEEHAVLIDAGLTGMAQAIAEAMAEAGAPLARLTHIAITHTDMDHIGSVAALRKLATFKLACHEAERRYLEGDEPPIRMAQMEASLPTMPEGQRAVMEPLFKSLRDNYKRLSATVDCVLTGGESLPCGLVAVHTPGHTPGHLCYYHKPSGTLVAGDMFNVEGGQLVAAPAFTMLQPEAYGQSLRKLLAYGIAAVACYHGGLYEGNANAAIRELAGV